MSMVVRSNGDVVFHCAFHVVWCPKYRRRIIAGDMQQRLEQLIGEVCDARGAWIVSLRTMPDQVHLQVEVDPQFGVHRLVKAVKGHTSRVLRDEFPHLRSRLPTLWTNSYFVATTGGVSPAAVNEFIEQQRTR